MTKQQGRLIRRLYPVDHEAILFRILLLLMQKLYNIYPIIIKIGEIHAYC